MGSERPENGYFVLERNEINDPPKAHPMLKKKKFT